MWLHRASDGGGWNDSLLSCLYVIWNTKYFSPRTNVKLLWRKKQYKRWEPLQKFPQGPQGDVQVTSKPLLREVCNRYMVNPFGTPCSKWRPKRDLLYSLLLQLPRRQPWIRWPERLFGNFHACGVSESWDKVDFQRCGSCFSNVLLYTDGPYGNYELALYTGLGWASEAFLCFLSLFKRLSQQYTIERHGILCVFISVLSSAYSLC